MITVFSFWTQATNDLGAISVPAVADAYPQASWSAQPPAGSGRGAVTVTDPPATLLADSRFPQLQPGDDPATLDGYRAALQAALDQWHGTWTQAVTYNGTTYTLRATPDAQANFVAYVASINLQLSQGLILATSPLPLQQAPETNGDGSVTTPVATLAVSDLLAVLGRYSQAVMVRELNSYNAISASIAAAITATQLDAITFGS